MDRDPSPNVPPTEAESPLPTSAVTAIRGDRWSFDAILVAGTYRSEMQSKSNRWELALLALFGTVVASFLSATAYSQYRAAAIDERAGRLGRILDDRQPFLAREIHQSAHRHAAAVKV